MEKKQRLIDTDDLLQTLAAQFDNLDPRWLRDRIIGEGLKIVKKAIEAAPTVDVASVQHGEWISVKDERKPPNFKVVLITDGECVDLGAWQGGRMGFRFFLCQRKRGHHTLDAADGVAEGE